MISVEKAIRIILENTKPLPSEKVSILEARGRVLAEDIYARRSLPPKDNSGMDGFAFRFLDNKSGCHPIKISGQAKAGDPSRPVLGAYEAIKIMTGASLPEGADTVVPIEDVQVMGDVLKINGDIPRGSHIRRVGEDIVEGERVLASGRLIKPADIAMIASIGKSFVQVRQRPRAAILATGDELIDIDEATSSDRIINSNAYGLAAQIAEAGGIPVMLGIGPDDPCKLIKMFERSASCDVAITTGGVSMGDYDFMRRVFAETGVEVKFWKAAMKPGKPVFFGTRGQQPVFGLPGNPVSSLISFEQFIRPCLKLMQGHNSLFRHTFKAIIDKKAGCLTTEPDRMDFIRCRIERPVEQSDCNLLKVVNIQKQGSHLLSSMTNANALMLLPIGCSKAGPDDLVLVQILDAAFFES